jgi:hypothetical protein
MTCSLGLNKATLATDKLVVAFQKQRLLIEFAPSIDFGSLDFEFAPWILEVTISNCPVKFLKGGMSSMYNNWLHGF